MPHMACLLVYPMINLLWSALTWLPDPGRLLFFFSSACACSTCAFIIMLEPLSDGNYDHYKEKYKKGVESRSLAE